MHFLFASSLRLTPLGLALKIARQLFPTLHYRLRPCRRPGDFVRDRGKMFLLCMYKDVLYAGSA